MPKEIYVKSVLNKKKYRDSWFLDDYTVNLYSSCSFNCLYCYIRGSKYGKNLEQSLSVKVNGIELLDKQLKNRAKKNQYGIIVLSSVTDPYIKIDEKYQYTREALKLILKHKFPVHMITKSDLIERDYDLLREIDNNAILPNDLKANLKRGCIVSFSFSTINDEIAMIFEPSATSPSKRLTVLNKTKKQGFLTGVSLMPLLPFITDTKEHLNSLFKTFKNEGIDYILPATLTLYGSGKADSKTLMLNAISRHFPHLLKKYIAYFEENNEMPLYYRNAFYHKMNELCREFRLKNRIL